MRIAVIGLGKIGLPLAVQFAGKGHHVVGVDSAADVVDLVNEGKEPFPGETDLADNLSHTVMEGLLSATLDGKAAVSSASAVVVAVPLYVDGEARPDFSAIDMVTGVIGDAVQPGALVSFETTLPVGTTRERISPEISRRSGMRVGTDFYLVFSPERVLTGRVFADLRRYPKLVGGVTADCEEAGVRFYEQVLDFDERPDLTRPNGVWRMGSAEAAEMSKLAETTYRDVNIGLANQFALYAEKRGLDVHKVIEACNSQPFSHIHQPGVAVGGHCIPVYPQLYLWDDPGATVVRAARKANASMPDAVAARVEQALGGLAGKSVLILGASYRGGVKETAFSGVFPLRDALQALGASVLVQDPLFESQELSELGLRPYEPGEIVDAAILQAAHQEYLPWQLPWRPTMKLMVDGRGVIDPADWPNVRVIQLGRS